MINKAKSKSLIFETLEEKKSVSTIESKNNFKVSFEHLDTTQKFGSGFRDFQKCGLLSKCLETLNGYCKSPLNSQVDGDKFTIYGNFPPKGRTMFTYPTHVPEDAKWARIHITGPCVLVGHVINDTFYVVFLDKTHKFYLTKKAAGIK